MAQIYLTASTADGRKLSISPLSSAKLARCAEPPEDDSGYFLIEEREADPLKKVTILARFVNEDAAFQLGKMLCMS